MAIRTTVTAAAEPAPRTSAPTAPRDAELLAVLEASATPGERIEAAFLRKERELAAVFVQLSVPEARELHRRLANPRPDDLVAARFARLVVARRHRLLAVLADARRREALATTRR